MDLRDVPEGAISQFILDSIADNLAAEFRQEADSRRTAVARGAETPGLSSLFWWGCSLGWGRRNSENVTDTSQVVIKSLTQLWAEAA